MDVQPKKEYYLQSDPQQKGWGPFETEQSAWKYLFGREPKDNDITQHKEAGWYVGFVNKW